MADRFDNRGNLNGRVDLSNSTVTPLGIGGVFIGAASEITNCGIVFVNIVTDQESAADGLSMQQSSDGTNWDHTDDYTVLANSAKNYSLNPHSKFYRIVYTNGGVEQGVFRLQSICKANSKASSHRIKDDIVGDDDCVLVKAALTGENGDGEWHNIKTTAEGRLDVSALNEKIQIARGLISGMTFIEKFGRNANVDVTPGSEFIWTAGGAWVPPTEARVHNLASTDVDDTILGDGARQVLISGLDTDWNPQSETVDLDGQDDSPTSGLYVIIHRMEVTSCGASGSNEGTISATAAVDGTVTAEIAAGKGKTLMAIYGIKAGASLYLEQIYASINAVSNPANPALAVLELKAIKSADAANPCTVVEHVWGVAASGTSNAPHEFRVSKVIPEKSIIYIQTESVTQDDSDISAGFDGYLIDD